MNDDENRDNTGKAKADRQGLKQPKSKNRAKPANTKEQSIKKQSAKKRGNVIMPVIIASLLGAAGGTVGGVAAMKYLQKSDNTAAKISEKLSEQLSGKISGKISGLENELGRQIRALQADNDKLHEEYKNILQASKQLGSDSEILSARLEEVAISVQALQDKLNMVDVHLQAAEVISPGQSDIAAPEKPEEIQPDETGEKPETEIETETESGQQSRAENLPGRQISTIAEMPKPAAAKQEPKPVNQQALEKKSLQSLIDSFPKDKILAGIEAQEKLARKKPGWIKKILSKHIRVRDTGRIDQYKILEQAEEFLTSGDIEKALAEMAKLNPSVRAVANEWMVAARKTLKARQNRQKKDINNEQ